MPSSLSLAPSVGRYFRAVPSERHARYSPAFRQLEDADGFGATWGPRTTERRSKCYNFTNGAQCNWNAPSWPFETAKAGSALIHLLHDYPAQRDAGIATFDRLLRQYARAHTRTVADGLAPPHVDEDLHPDDGYWIVRRKLHGTKPWPNTGGLGGPRDPQRDRGTHYFHSSYVDLVLSGLVGVHPTRDYLELRPLTTVGYFCVQRLAVRGLELDVVWDRTGFESGYPRLGAGMHVWVDGVHVGSAPPVRLRAARRGGGGEGSAEVGGDVADDASDGRLHGYELGPPRLRLSWDGKRLVRCAGALSGPDETPRGATGAWEC